MREETRLHVSTAIGGLSFSMELIEQDLLGKKRGYPARLAENGPFAQALGRVAEIADGAPMGNIEAVRADLLMLFEMLRFLHGGFWSSAWEIMKPVHDLVADRVSTQEAAAILGEPESMVALEERIGRLHALDLLGTVWARYEVEALKAKWEMAMAPVRRHEERAANG